MNLLNRKEVINAIANFEANQVRRLRAQEELTEVAWGIFGVLAAVVDAACHSFELSAAECLASGRKVALGYRNDYRGQRRSVNTLLTSAATHLQECQTHIKDEELNKRLHELREFIIAELEAEEFKPRRMGRTFAEAIEKTRQDQEQGPGPDA